jgi:hypothetical protein
MQHPLRCKQDSMNGRDRRTAPANLKPNAPSHLLCAIAQCNDTIWDSHLVPKLREQGSLPNVALSCQQLCAVPRQRRELALQALRHPAASAALGKAANALSCMHRGAVQSHNDVRRQPPAAATAYAVEVGCSVHASLHTCPACSWLGSTPHHRMLCFTLLPLYNHEV